METFETITSENFESESHYNKVQLTKLTGIINLHVFFKNGGEIRVGKNEEGDIIEILED